MDITEFEDKLQMKRAANGWRIELECNGLWIYKVYDRDTDELLASTGATALSPLLETLNMPFTQSPWGKPDGI